MLSGAGEAALSWKRGRASYWPVTGATTWTGDAGATTCPNTASCCEAQSAGNGAASGREHLCAQYPERAVMANAPTSQPDPSSGAGHGKTEEHG